MNNMYEGLDAWHLPVEEPVIDPGRTIVDPHHHIHQREGRLYLLDDLLKDTGNGHRVLKTVFTQCTTHYRPDGPEHLRPVGETEFIAGLADQSRHRGAGSAAIAGIVGYADLRLGARLDEVLDAHEEAGRGLFRGIRQVAASDPHEELKWIGAQVAPGLYRDPDFLAGLQLLGRRGLSFDAWHFHHQMPDFIAAVRATPGTTFVLDHFSGLLGVGPYADRRTDVVAQWQRDMAELARLPNVYAKLGGTTMPANGFGFEKRATPIGSDAYVAALGDRFRYTIECFGAGRCMFESNFPVDKIAISYRNLWNAYKKIAAPSTESEKEALFSGTATRVYRL